MKVHYCNTLIVLMHVNVVRFITSIRDLTRLSFHFLSVSLSLGLPLPICVYSNVRVLSVFTVVLYSWTELFFIFNVHISRLSNSISDALDNIRLSSCRSHAADAFSSSGSSLRNFRRIGAASFHGSSHENERQRSIFDLQPLGVQEWHGNGPCQVDCN